MTRPAALLAAAFAVVALPVLAQDSAADDKSFLEGLLQDKLSAAGRTVEVTGFQGALSSRATMERLTVADDEGVWLTLEGAVLDWTRSALLAGRLEIDALSAERIEISRPPVAVSDGPQPAASDFALPELPVSIDIGRISAAHLVLGEPVLGVAAELSLDGRAKLDGGAGEAALTLARIDGREGRFSLAAAYANDSRVLSLDLALDEGPGGIVATLTGLPGGAPLAFTVAGTGPIDAYAAEIALATEGTRRIGGTVTLTRPAPEAPLAFTADLAGDPTALMAPDYRGFFGDDVRLAVAGQRDAAGRLDLGTLAIEAQALTLSGSAVIAAGGWPERVDLTGAVASPDGQPVRLPLSGEATWIDRAGLRFSHDAARGEDWRAEVTLDNLSRPDLRLARATLTGTGTLTPGIDGALPGFAGHVELAANGLTGAADGAAAALGPNLTGAFDLARSSGERLRFENLALRGADYRLTGDVSLGTEVDKLDLVAAGDITLAADDLSRFAGLAGQTLSGAARLRIAGEAAVPGGPFDVEITGEGRDLGVGIAEADRLMAGPSTLALTAARTAAGTEIERFEIRATGASASGTAWLAATDSQLALRLDMPDAARLAAGLDGPLAAEVTALQKGETWDLALKATAPGGTRLDATATAAANRRGLLRLTGSFSGAVERLAAWSGLARRDLSGSAAFSGSGRFNPAEGNFGLEVEARGRDLDFDLGTADQLTRGASTLDVALRRNKAGVLIVDNFRLATPELDLEAKGRAADEMPRITFDGRLRDLGLFVPGLPGALSLGGNARLTEDGWQLRLDGDGPGGTTIRASGLVAGDGARADLALAGRVPLALVNDAIAPRALSGMAAFDLALDGPIGLGSLSGRVRTQAARLSLPTAGFALDPIDATVDLSSGQAMVDARAALTSGGRITARGPVALTSPWLANLSLDLRNVRLRDESLYDITLGGNLAISGALAGGAGVTGGLRVAEAELRIPETGFGIDGSLEGLRHVGAPPAVRATRARAGLTGKGAGSSGGGASWGLGITIDAPGAVFIRGRGLDAELGGRLTVAGTTRDVVTTGGVSLIRGRLDILGNRLALTEGSATLRGSLDPTLHLQAETQAEEVTVRVSVDGLASDPNVTFSSSPELPEDEILARLIFGRGLDQISPFQALKLASAVATLSGRGGAGTIGRLREGFGLDDLDVATGADGGLQLKAGTYISDNIYTDVTVGADGRAEVNLNLTLTPNVTARGSVGSDGSTGLGVFFEKDY